MTALYNKYRPSNLSEIIGQQHITDSLINIICRSDKINQIYLFVGPHGIGKTSTARAYSKTLNCVKSNKPTIKPCGKCQSCISPQLDIIEIDAASNTGVDNTLENIKASHLAPHYRYRITIIDEVHALSSASFKALLKTLEEPPPKAIFILCTTEVNKIPTTIISRAFRYDFNTVELTQITAHLKKICKSEDIKYQPQSLEVIAKLSKGHLRDAIKMLEQANLLEVSPEWVYKLCGQVSDEQITELVRTIAAGKTKMAIALFDGLLSYGANAQTIISKMSECVQAACMEGGAYHLGGREFLGDLLEKLNCAEVDVKQCLDANLALRSRITSWCIRQDKTPPIYQIWESPVDAFDWCASVIPNMERFQMQEIFDNLTPIQGSKARAWYFKVIELYNSNI
ncbi:MAG: DNA polymerase III subunit gamma/tau [Cyanobacteria bacterium J06633_8]